MNRYPFIQRSFILLPAVMLLTALLAAGCGSLGNGPVVLTEKVANGTVSVQRGDTVRILLPANPATGYQWHWEIQGDAVQKESEEFLPPAASSHLVGAPGSIQLNLRAVQTGTTTIIARYYRPWEAFQPDRDRQIIFTIRVQAE